MNFPYTINFKNGESKVVWVEAENQAEADEYSLNYWSNPEVTAIEQFIEPTEPIDGPEEDVQELSACYNESKRMNMEHE